MHITYDMVKEDLPRIIEQEGRDYIYSAPQGSGDTCMYVWQDKPSCLIGRYLVDLGLPLNALKGIEVMGIERVFKEDMLKHYGFTAEPEAMYALDKVQWNQDNQYAWGDAYDRVFDSEQ